MIDLFVLWEKFCGEFNTHQGGHVRPNRNFVHWVNDISKDIFNDKYKDAWQKSQKITDDLAKPFLRSELVKVQPGGTTYDLVPYPGDYGHISAMRYFYKDKGNGVEPDDYCKLKEDPNKSDGFYYETVDAKYSEVGIRILTNNKWEGISEHKMLKPKLDSPATTQYGMGFKIAPKGLQHVMIDYLRPPKEATFDYTLDAEDNIIYNSATSKKLEWSSLLITEFTTRLGKKYGKFIREGMVYQISNAEQKETK